jgi:hypothetical protein
MSAFAPAHAILVYPVDHPNYKNGYQLTQMKEVFKYKILNK